MQKNVAIKVENLSKNYSIKLKEPGLLGSLKAIYKSKTKEVKAVKNISFTIKEGEMIGFIGPNGAGKTTTLKMLSGILFPTSGNMNVLGYTPFDRNHDFLKKISLVMGQKNQLIWELPAIDTFNLNKETYEIPEANYKRTLDELITLFEIGDILTTQVRKLSLGQRMKCELVASLLHNPKILFLDEPTIGLDIIIQKKLRQFVKRVNEKFGTTVILTSHYMDDVKEIAERVIVINKGSLIFDDKLAALTKKFANYKTVSLTLNADADQKVLKMFDKVVKYEYPELVIKVRPEKIAETTSYALKNLDVDDIDISEPELEDIVEVLFKK